MFVESVRRNLHVIVCCALLLAFFRLQFTADKFGWPFPVGLAFVWLNFIPAIIILSLGMIPFSYDSDRTTSLKGFFLLTACAAIVAVLLPKNYAETLNAFDRLLIVFLFTMMVYGFVSWMWSVVGSMVYLPFPIRKKTDEED